MQIQRKDKPYKLSKIGQARLETAHPLLQALIQEMLWYKDLSVIETTRSQTKQLEYVAKGVSKTMYSKHLPKEDGYSRAIDIYPYPVPRVRGEIDSNSREWDRLAAVAFFCAGKLGIENLNWGGLWNTFIDKPHYELEEK